MTFPRFALAILDRLRQFCRPRKFGAVDLFFVVCAGAVRWLRGPIACATVWLRSRGSHASGNDIMSVARDTLSN